MPNPEELTSMEEAKRLEEIRKLVDQKCVAKGVPTLTEMIAFAELTGTEREYRALAHSIWYAAKAEQENRSAARQKQLRARVAKRHRAFERAVLEVTGSESMDSAIAEFRELCRMQEEVGANA